MVRLWLRNYIPQKITDETISSCHDDVIKWKHFPRYYPLVRGIHIGWVNNREAGDLRRHRAHHDVTVMPSSNLIHVSERAPRVNKPPFLIMTNTTKSCAKLPRFIRDTWVDIMEVGNVSRCIIDFCLEQHNNPLELLHWYLDNLMIASNTVYPKKYAHGFCFAVLCCCYTLTDFPISIRLTSLALWQSNDCPSASKATLMNMDKYFIWIHYERLHTHNKAKHNKTVCIFLGIYCTA